MILYQFGAEWCNPCKVQREILINNPIEGADYVFVDCDADENEELVEKYGIVDLPTLLLMDKDKVLKRWVGLTRRDEIQKVVYSYFIRIKADDDK